MIIVWLLFGKLAGGERDALDTSASSAFHGQLAPGLRLASLISITPRSAAIRSCWAS